MTELTLPFHPPFQGRQMPLTERDCIEMEKPEWRIQMETMLEVLNEGVVMADDSHRILFANSRFVEMTGILRQDLTGFDISHFYSAEEWDFLKLRAHCFACPARISEA